MSKQSKDALCFCQLNEENLWKYEDILDAIILQLHNVTRVAAVSAT